VEVGGVPGMVLRRDGSSGDDVMDVGVVVELTAPGVEDTEEAWEISSDVLGISSQGDHGLGRGCEQGIVRGALVAADEGVELLGDGEGDEEMVSWHLPLHLFMEPLMSLLVLTGGAVTVSAGAEEEMGFTTLLTLIESGSEGLGSTVDDGTDDLEVIAGHGVFVPFHVLRAVGSEDVIDCSHGLESLHDLVDELTGVFVSLLGEVEIDHGGLQAGMAHVFLDDPQIDSCL